MRFNLQNGLKSLVFLVLVGPVRVIAFDQVDNCIDIGTCGSPNPSEGCIFLNIAEVQEASLLSCFCVFATEDAACEIGLGMANESCAGDTGRTQWNRLVVEYDGLVDITLTNCDFNAVLSIWDDCYGEFCGGDPDELACSNHAGFTAGIHDFPVQVGGSYWVKYASIAGSDEDGSCVATVTFNPDEPPNDDVCGGAEEIDSNDFTATQDITNATIDEFEPQETCDDGANGVSQSVWYRFRPDDPGLLDIDTNGSSTNWDPVLSISTGGCGPDPFACNDDGGTGLNARLHNIELHPPQEYYIKVANDDAAQTIGVQLTLNATFSPFPRMSFTGTPYVHGESGSQTVTVTPNRATILPTSVDYETTSGGTASPGVDFTPVSGTLTWGPGDATSKTFTVPILPDSCDESDETIAVRIFNPSGASGSSSTHITITDDDAAPGIVFQNAALSVSESAAAATIVVLKPGCSGHDVRVDYATSDGTGIAGEDYVHTSGTLTWPANDLGAKSFQVPIISNDCDDLNRIVNVTLSAPSNGQITGINPAVLGITDDDPTPSVSFVGAPYVAGESSGDAPITAVIDACSNEAVSVNFATSNGTAVSPGDYTPASGTLTWLATDTTPKTFLVPVQADGFNEADETVNLTLSNPVNGTLGTPSATTLTITDNDPPPVVSFSGAPYTHAELNFPTPSQAVTVRISAAPGITTRVTLVTSNNTATAGEDYSAVGPTVLTWNAGDGAPKTVNVPILLDECDEPDETIRVTLLNAVNCTIGSGNPTTITITDNDPPPVVSFAGAPFSEAENSDRADVKVALTGCSSRTVSVRYATSDGTAESSAPSPDYEATGGTFVWPRGDNSSRFFDVPIVADACHEPDETINVTLGSAVNCTIGAGNPTTLTITDDDLPVPADLDGDCDVDLDDFVIFEACMTGPDVPYHPDLLPLGCSFPTAGGTTIPADFNEDGFVDLYDLSVFFRSFVGG